MPLSLFRSCFKAFPELNIQSGLPFLPMVITANRDLAIQSQILRETKRTAASGRL